LLQKSLKYLKNINLPYLDKRSLMLFRILLGACIILDIVINKWPHISYFYVDSGVYTKELLELAINTNPYREIQKYSLLWFFNNEAQVKGFFFLTLFSFALYMVGFRPKLFGFIGLVLLLSIHSRNPYVLSGPDQILISLLAWSLFLPINNLKFFASSNKEAFKVSSIAAVGLITQIALIYFFNAFLKDGHIWKEGNGLAYALMEDLWVKPSASFLLEYPKVCSLLSYGTIVVEYLIALLILIPFKQNLLRAISVVLIIMLHGTIFSFLSLGLFPLVALCIVAVLLPSLFWDKALRVFKNVKHTEETSQNPTNNIVLNTLGAVFFVLVFWKSMLSINHYNNKIYYPNFLKYLDKTTLFTQYWAMYAPNPTLIPSWYKVVAFDSEGNAIDTRTNQFHKDDLTHIEEYRDYTFALFFYYTFVYPDELSENIKQRWAVVEKQQWDKHQPNNVSKAVYIYAFSKEIISPSITFPINKVVVGSAQ
jgi:hypothetical protein